MSYTFQIASVRPVPTGFRDNVRGLVDFTYVPSELDPPLCVTRWSKAKEKEYNGLTITGARVVRVHDAQLVAHEGKHFISVQNLQIPRAVSDCVAAEALKMLNGQAARPAVAAHPTNDASSYGIGSPQFQQGGQTR